LATPSSFSWLLFRLKNNEGKKTFCRSPP
jgi:hypothetical protein